MRTARKGIKARRTCERIAARTGGLMLPTMWWGGGGGHDVFKWSHYQPPEAITAMLDTTARQLLDFGARALVLLAGHYPWQSFLDETVPALRADYPDALVLAGTEVSICGDAVQLKGDHAAKEETSFGLALFPEWVDLGALQRLAVQDPLTGIANRQGFQALLASRLAEHEGEGLTLGCLDLDNFRRVNDALGHQAGDRLILQVVARLKAQLEVGDTLARLGGDDGVALPAQMVDYEIGRAHV